MARSRPFLQDQDYVKLRDELLADNDLFYDDYFKTDVPHVMWMRPPDLVDDPRFFVGTASRFDVVQGRGSDCWLLVAMANLTTNPAMFDHVVPKDQGFADNYAGIFRFNIWQCGEWVEVVVDDRLPTNVDTKKLIFLRSRTDNEFWSALLEKAYAKLYGSYNELTSGYFSEAMVDFTGGIVEKVILRPPPANLASIINKSLAKSSFMCVFMRDDPNTKESIGPLGLVKGHAYGLTKFQTLTINGGQRVDLIRLRNPWGKIEWKGAWSDDSPEWNQISENDKKNMGLVADNDGEFWMSIPDFSSRFEDIEICHLGPQSFTNADGIVWDSHFFKKQWIKGVTAGGLSGDTFHLNPQFRIILDDKDDDSDMCTVIIGLMQRNKSRNYWHKIGITAFYLTGPEKDSKSPLSKEYLEEHFDESSSSPFRRTRENVIRDNWKEGVYCIVPSTYKAGEEGQFLLRVYTEKASRMVDHEDEAVGSPTKFSLKDHKKQEDDSNDPARSIPTVILPSRPGPFIPARPESVEPEPRPEPALRNRTKFLHKDEQQLLEYFKSISGENEELNWEGLQKILDYALDDGKSGTPSESGNLLSAVISFFSSLFSSSSEKKVFNKQECRAIITLLDDDRSGTVSWREFQVLWRRLKNWELVYQNYCSDTNRMDSAELREALRSAGYRVSTSEYGRLVKTYGDNDGKLLFDDFVMCAIEAMNAVESKALQN